MDAMFRPIPYLAMPKPKVHPDFVVMYAYKPSDRLAIANGEYQDDSFMLDGTDDENLPLPLRSTNASYETPYKLPAFGVTYGMQYMLITNGYI